MKTAAPKTKKTVATATAKVTPISKRPSASIKPSAASPRPPAARKPKAKAAPVPVLTAAQAFSDDEVRADFLSVVENLALAKIEFASAKANREACEANLAGMLEKHPRVKIVMEDTGFVVSKWVGCSTWIDKTSLLNRGVAPDVIASATKRKEYAVVNLSEIGAAADASHGQEEGR